MPYFDRFDVVEAHFLFYRNYHRGQNSKEYLRLSRIKRYFRPSPLLLLVKDLTNNGKAIYSDLIKKYTC